MKTYFKNLFSAITGAKTTPPAVRSFKGASVGRLTNDWITSPIDTNEDIRANLSKLIDRSEDLAKNNSYFRKYLAMREKNIIGPDGVILQMKAADDRGLDEIANSKIENAWADWAATGNCTIDGKLSLFDVQRLLARCKGIYGEWFVRLHEGADNKYGFAVEVISPALCDVDYNVNFYSYIPGQPRIVMGVELDQADRPIAYYFKTGGVGSYGGRQRVSAREILHGFKTEFPGQVRGVPPASSAIYTIHMFEGYNEAVLVNARAAACKMGFLYLEGNGEYSPDGYDGNTQINEASPGKIEKLPPGVKFQEYDPKQPTQGHDAYTKTLQREIASGFDVAYSSFANDLENVNYSSIRAGVLEERDTWRCEQRELIEHFMEPVFQRWLPFFLLSGTDLPYSKMWKWKMSTWIPRSFAWISPQEDTQAMLLMLQNNLTTPQKIAAESGRDLRDIYADIQAADKLAREFGIWKPVSQSKTTPLVDKPTSDKGGNA